MPTPAQIERIQRTRAEASRAERQRARDWRPRRGARKAGSARRLSTQQQRLVKARRDAAVWEREQARRWDERNRGERGPQPAEPVPPQPAESVPPQPAEPVLQRMGFFLRPFRALGRLCGKLGRQLMSLIGLSDPYIEDERLRELFLTRDQLKQVEIIRELGEGFFGIVELVRYAGEEMVMKTLKQDGLDMLVDEARILLLVAGAGGAPLVKGLASRPPRMLMSCVGQSLFDCVENEDDWTEGDLLYTLLDVGRALQEVHDRGVIHNDLKLDNIAVTGRKGELKCHIIDFGESSVDGTECPIIAQISQKWMAPELRQKGGISTRKSDVYSYGHLIAKSTSSLLVTDDIKQKIGRLAQEGTQGSDPESRWPLLRVVEELQRIVEDQSCLEKLLWTFDFESFKLLLPRMEEGYLD